jgi:hypothetical protein
MSLVSLPQLSDQFNSADPTNPASYLYVPPVGTYQNDAGQIVSKSTPNVSSTPSTVPSLWKQLATGTGQGAGFHLPSLQDATVILVGLILIAAGVFSFKTAQSIIVNTGKLAAKTSELAA